VSKKTKKKTGSSRRGCTPVWPCVCVEKMCNSTRR